MVVVFSVGNINCFQSSQHLAGMSVSPTVLSFIKLRPAIRNVDTTETFKYNNILLAELVAALKTLL